MLEPMCLGEQSHGVELITVIEDWLYKEIFKYIVILRQIGGKILIVREESYNQ